MTSAAYLKIKIIETVHGYIDVRLIIIYLMAMCALQCILAITIDLNTDIRQFVDRYYPDSEFFHEKKRLYGFGCGLDVAGGRFAAVLIMIAYLLYNNSKKEIIGHLSLLYDMFHHYCSNRQYDWTHYNNWNGVRSYHNMLFTIYIWHNPEIY